jgi:hypothetical protein
VIEWSVVIACGTVVLTVSLCFLVGLMVVCSGSDGTRARDLFSALRRENESLGERATTEDRSGALLRDLLTEREYEELAQRGYLDVASPSIGHRIYRIPRDGGLVRVYEQGRAVRSLCVQPAVPLPSKDVIVLHKLMIQGSEQQYLACARTFPINFP